MIGTCQEKITIGHGFGFVYLKQQPMSELLNACKSSIDIEDEGSLVSSSSVCCAPVKMAEIDRRIQESHAADPSQW